MDKKNRKDSILRAVEYLENNSSLEENFIMVNKIANLNRLNKKYNYYKYNLQDFFINKQNLKDLKFINSKLYGLNIKNSLLDNFSFNNVQSNSSNIIDSRVKNCNFSKCSFKKLVDQNSKLIHIGVTTVNGNYCTVGVI